MNAIARSAILISVLLSSAASAAPEDIRLYEASTLTRHSYEIVGRLWVESWRSAFQVPMHASRDAAVSALKAEALRRGANALTNVTCFADDAPLPLGGPHFCYALAIRLK